MPPLNDRDRWPLTFWPQNIISSSLSQDALLTKVWRKSTNAHHRCVETTPRTDGRTHGWTTQKHNASAALRHRLKMAETQSHPTLRSSYLGLVQFYIILTPIQKQDSYLDNALNLLSFTLITNKHMLYVEVHNHDLWFVILLKYIHSFMLYFQ